ncbi:MAG: hypothetical protein RR620_07470 [Clostridium sp.]
MKKDRYNLKLAGVLILSSLILYLINYILFKDLHHILMFLTEDLAFIPIEVLVTVLIIDRELERREKSKKSQKVNLLIEIFFEEVGNELLSLISSKDVGHCEIRKLMPQSGESINDYSAIEARIENYNCTFVLKGNDVNDVYELLHENKESFFRFIENPYLGEHDVFTDLLQSAFHLYNDIKSRKKKGEYTQMDLDHISEDVSRLYKYLSKEWAVYMKYIEKEYPFLYALALKNMPFNND